MSEDKNILDLIIEALNNNFTAAKTNFRLIRMQHRWMATLTIWLFILTIMFAWGLLR